MRKGQKVPFKNRNSNLAGYCTEEWLMEHYIQHGLTAAGCGEIIGVSKTTILRWLTLYNIPRRDMREHNYEKLIAYNRSRMVIVSKEWLTEHYVTKKLSARECAELYGCSETQIKDLLKENGIKRRRCTWKANEVTRQMVKEGIWILQTLDRTGDNNPTKRPEVREKIRQGKLGKRNPMWNPNITEEERIKGRCYDDYVMWRKSVYERDNYTCQCCKGKGGNGKRFKIAAHHLYSHHDNRELRLQLENGITLCWTCHGEFHRLYGRGNNTLNQFAEYMESKGKKLKIKHIQLTAF